MAYGLSRRLLTGSGKQLTSKFLQHVCRILGIKHAFTRTYHLQTDGQVERYNQAVIAELQYIVEQHLEDWNLYHVIFTIGCNAQNHRIANCTSFEFMLSQSPKAFVIKPDHESILGESRGSCPDSYKIVLSQIVYIAREHMRREQNEYQRRYKKNVRPIADHLQIGSFSFIWSKHSQHGKRHTSFHTTLMVSIRKVWTARP